MSDRLAWSDLENDAIVADYMAILSADLSGLPYSKAEHNRALQQLLGRGRGSIEYKYQNISAMLKGIGEVELPGYKPAFNYQASLEDAVGRWLAERPGWYAYRSQEAASAGLQETGALWIGTAPTLQNARPPNEAEQMARIARRFDAAGRDDRNRKLGRAGEKRVLDHESASLLAAGRSDLARKIRWVSEEAGNGLGYDVLSFEPNGAERMIEVKRPPAGNALPFISHVTRSLLPARGKSIGTLYASGILRGRRKRLPSVRPLNGTWP